MSVNFITPGLGIGSTINVAHIANVRPDDMVGWGIEFLLANGQSVNWIFRNEIDRDETLTNVLRAMGTHVVGTSSVTPY